MMAIVHDGNSPSHRDLIWYWYCGFEVLTCIGMEVCQTLGIYIGIKVPMPKVIEGLVQFGIESDQVPTALRDIFGNM